MSGCQFSTMGFICANGPQYLIFSSFLSDHLFCHPFISTLDPVLHCLSLFIKRLSFGHQIEALSKLYNGGLI